VNMLRSIVNAAFERARPFAAPIGLTIAEAGLIALRATIENLTAERDQLEQECEQRRAYLAGGPDYLDDVDDVDLGDLVEPTKAQAAEDDAYYSAVAAEIDRQIAGAEHGGEVTSVRAAAEIRRSTPAPLVPDYSVPMLASEYLNAGWWWDAEVNVWRPPSDKAPLPAATPNSWPINPNVVRAEEVAAEPMTAEPAPEPTTAEPAPEPEPERSEP